MWKTWIWFLGWEDPLKKGMGTHFSILAWRIPWTEEPGRLQSMGSRRVSKDWATFTFTKLTIKVMYLNHPETTPLHLDSWKNCLPRNWSLVPKGWGPLLYRKIGVITNLHQTLTVFCYRSLIPNIRLASRLMQCVCVYSSNGTVGQVFPRNRTSRRFIIRTWLPWLWSLRSHRGEFQSQILSLKAWETRGNNSVNPNLRDEKIIDISA